MTTPDIKFPSQHDLSLRRPAPGMAASDADRQAAIAKAQCQLLADMEAFREREDNLRAYEARLRAMQDEFESGRYRGTVKIPSPEESPLADSPGVDAAWRKLHRAREILEIELKHLQTERLGLKEERTALRQREEAVASREARLENLEKHLEAKIAKSSQGILGLTRAPFNLAKTVFTKS